MSESRKWPQDLNSHKLALTMGRESEGHKTFVMAKNLRTKYGSRIIFNCWIVNHWNPRITSKTQRSFELSKRYIDAGYILALDTENVREPESLQGCLVLFFIQQANIRYLLSHSLGHKGFVCALWNNFNSFWLSPSRSAVPIQQCVADLHYYNCPWKKG